MVRVKKSTKDPIKSEEKWRKYVQMINEDVARWFQEYLTSETMNRMRAFQGKSVHTAKNWLYCDG